MNDPFPGPAPNAWRETECRTRGLLKDGPSLRTEVDELLLLYLAELQPLAWGWQESNLRPVDYQSKKSHPSQQAWPSFVDRSWGCAVARRPEYRVNKE